MIRCDKDGDVWTVTIDRPDKAGALTRDMLTELAEIAEAAQVAKLFILTGTGSVFSAGGLLNGAVSHVLAVDKDLPAGGLFQPGDQTQYRGFTAAGGAEQRHHLPLRDRQVDVFNYRVRAKALGHVTQFNKMFLSHSVTPGFWL